MIHLPEFLSPDLLRPLGLTLLHFIWQGAALAALAALAMALTKSASARYVLGIAALLAMVAAPIVTFVALQQDSSAKAVAPQPVSQLVLIHTGNLSDPHSAMRLSNGMHPAPTPAPDKSYLWLVQAWFLGVLLFSMRTAGGVLALERLRRREATPIGDTLLESCLKLQRRIGLHRVVRYCESVHLDAPAVIGWLRPVVLLPASTLTGLSEAQLLAVTAHELAHIRRYDAFVNLFQVAAESILFYHPAVWWMSQRIRTEREHCCDDIAIAVCGNPLEYARALTLMEELRAAPSLAMAANHGALASRVRRLLGIPSLGAGMRTAGIAAAVLCLSVATVAGNAMFGVARNAATAQEPATEQEQREKDVASAIVVRAPQNPATPAVAPTLPKPAPAPFAAAQAAPRAEPSEPQSPSNQNAQQNVHESYIDGMKAAGVDISSVDDLIAMKVHHTRVCAQHASRRN
jgi:beta-lactamase regulating signal transducer with metallopeptidase domain